MDNLSLQSKDSLRSDIANILRTQILEKKLKPGERLKQIEVAEMFGVSRMPVREAFYKLEQEGLITIIPRKGAIVNDFSKDDVLEIYHLRAILEKEAFSQSFDYITKQDMNDLELLVLKMDQVEDIKEYVSLNIKFHNMIMKYCTGKKLRSFIDILWEGFSQETPHLIKDKISISNREHKEILNHIKKNEKELAGNILAKHIIRTGNTISTRFFDCK